MVESMNNVEVADEIEFVGDDAESPDLYKGSLTLAHDTTTLLHETKLHLKKDKLYNCWARPMR